MDKKVSNLYSATIYIWHEVCRVKGDKCDFDVIFGRIDDNRGANRGKNDGNNKKMQEKFAYMKKKL